MSPLLFQAQCHIRIGRRDGTDQAAVQGALRLSEAFNAGADVRKLRFGPFLGLGWQAGEEMYLMF